MSTDYVNIEVREKTTDGCLASFQMLIGVIDNSQLIAGW